MLVYTYEYDTNYVPAMPVVEIAISSVSKSYISTIRALIDSGSDGTIIPLSDLKRIGARKYQKQWMRTITGQRAQVDLYLITVQLGPLQRARVAVAGDPKLNEAIIGRDLLNQLCIKLDGLATVVEILAI